MELVPALPSLSVAEDAVEVALEFVRQEALAHLHHRVHVGARVDRLQDPQKVLHERGIRNKNT